VALKTKAKPAGSRRRSSKTEVAATSLATTISSPNQAVVIPPVIPAKKAEVKPVRPDLRAKPRNLPFARQFGNVTRVFKGIRTGINRFVWEIRAELRKVVWPNRKEATNLTLIVVAVSAAVGVFLGGIDYIFRKLFELLVRV
jgi:preprotein translocase subunit SecE